MFYLRSAFTVMKVLSTITIIAILIGLLAVAWYGRIGGANAPTSGSPISLTEEDRQLVAEQKICPVSGQPLDPMGDPYRAEVENRGMFVCCKGCTTALRKDPAKYLEKLK